jgi:phospholipid/cholesterol/gamma-HCH transport system substrate-binding protein
VLVFVATRGGGHEYRLVFQNAGQLVTGDSVQVGGQSVGSVKDIELTNDNLAAVTISVDSSVAPLHEGSSAVIRAASLSGVANRYVSLTPGPNYRPKLADGATITADNTTSIVDLDQLFNTLDPQTRKALRQVLEGSATQYTGRERLANLTAYYLNPAVVSTTQLTEEIEVDNQAFVDFLVNAGDLMSTIASRRAELTSLVGNTGRTARAIANQNVSFSQALAVLPDALRQGNTTFVDLRSTLDTLDRLVAVSKPATRDLAPFLSSLRPVVTQARPVFGDLAAIAFQSGPGNDLTDNLRALPALARLARGVFPRAEATLRQSQPVVEFIRPYTPDLVGFLRDFGQGASPYDANGHYARVSPVFDAFSFTDDALGGMLLPKAPALRGESPFLSLSNLRRCPGAAAPAPADGSAPFVDSGPLSNPDCDPSQRPPTP